MKYSTSKKPLVCIQTQSSCYKGTSKMSIKGVLWHSTGANNPNLKRYIQPSDKKPSADTYDAKTWLKVLGANNNKNDLNHSKQSIGMNGWVGKLADGTVAAVQAMPWDFKPWGCASGSKGSCNNGWIQFEICEDNLGDKKYFEAIYKEACELTAYLCIIHNLDPRGTVLMNGVKVPVILCHADAHKLGFGSNHGDIYHWFKKYGKDMDDVRNDVVKLIEATKVQPEKKEKEEKEAKYFVRKSWTDTKSQIGAFASLDNAQKACDEAEDGYEVYDKTGKLIYPPLQSNFKIGDKVKIISKARWSTGSRIQSWVFNTELYVREIRTNGVIAVSTQETGALTGTIRPEYLTMANKPKQPEKPAIKPYLIIVTASSLNVRAGAGTNYKINTTIKKGQVYTIVDEKKGWGKLKSGAGWIYLDGYTEKLK